MRDHLGNLQLASNLDFARGVLLLDDCSGTFNWDVADNAGTTIRTYATVAAFIGTHGLHLATKSDTPTAADEVHVTKYIPFPQSGLLVARFLFASPDISDVGSFTVQMYVQDGSHGYLAKLKFTPATPKVEYLDSAGAFQVIAALTQDVKDAAWVTVELMLDVLTGQYRRVLFNGVEASLAGIPYQDMGADTYRGVGLTFSVVAVGAAVAEIYADQIAATEFEDL